MRCLSIHNTGILSLVLVVWIALNSLALSQQSDMHCGVRCMFVALHVLKEDSDVRLADLQSTLAPKESGNSLEELHGEAIRLGLHAMAVQTSLDAIRLRQGPLTCIAHLRRGHYVILSEIADETISIADPPRASTIPISTFLSEWSGDALLLSNTALEDESSVQNRLWWSAFYRRFVLTIVGVMIAAVFIYAIRKYLRSRTVGRSLRLQRIILVLVPILGDSAGCSKAPVATSPTDLPATVTKLNPDVSRNETTPVATGKLRIEPAVVDLGSVLINQRDLAAKFVVTNQSDDEIQIEEIRTSCGCPVAVPGKTVLQAGEATELIATVKALELGHKSSRIRLFATKSGASAEAAVRWEAGSVIGISPSKVHLGEILCGSRMESTITLRPPKDKLLSECVTSVTSLPESVISTVVNRDGAEWTVAVTVSPIHAESNGRAVVLVSCTPPYGDIRIPVEWVAAEAISLSPKGTFLGKVNRSSKWRARFIARSRDARITKVELADSDSPFKLQCENISESRVMCTLFGSTPDELGPFEAKASLSIRGADSVLATVPFSVSGIVGDSVDDSAEPPSNP